MLMKPTDELSIQKCVDNELTAEETRRLLRRLDSITDGWKTLACSLLEDRILERKLSPTQTAAVRAHVASPDSTVTKPAVAPSSTAASSTAASETSSLRRWWSHPVTSLTLCGAIAFVGGLLIPDRVQKGSQGDVIATRAAESPASTWQQPINGAAESAMYRVEMGSRGRSMEIPVVSELNELHDLDPEHPLFWESPQAHPNVQWLLVPVEGNKSMLLPVAEDASFNLQ